MGEGGNYLQGKTALRVVAVFAAAYFLSYALRAINAVIAPALMADLQLSNADLGLLSSAYKDAIAFVVILGVLFFMPGGLVGARRSERV